MGEQRAGLGSIAGEAEHTRVLPTLSRTEDRDHAFSHRVAVKISAIVRVMTLNSELTINVDPTSWDSTP